MTDENTSSTETAATEAPPAANTEQAQTTTDEFGDADREKMSQVVRKERAAARESRASAERAEARLAELEASELRRGVAAEKGLTTEQAAFLSGDSAEEMAASADSLLAAFPAAKRPSNPFERVRTGATGATEPAESMATVADRVLD
jgi:hypothetical protein